MKINKFISGLSFVYAASIILSLVFHNILPCIGETYKLDKLSYVLYISDLICTVARGFVALCIF